MGDGTCMLSVFGRNIVGSPEKYTIICNCKEDCDGLTDSINAAILV